MRVKMSREFSHRGTQGKDGADVTVRWQNVCKFNFTLGPTYIRILNFVDKRHYNTGITEFILCRDPIISLAIQIIVSLNIVNNRLITDKFSEISLKHQDD